MILPKFTFLEPATLEEASKLAKEYDGKCKLMAGGTDVIVAMKEKHIAPEYIIDLKRIPGLDYLDVDPEKGLKIGALTCLRTIERSQLVKEIYPAVADAAHYVASTQVRSKGTVYSGANDIGQGLDTVMTVVAAEELGLDMNEVKICVADTNLTPFDTGTLGSRGTFLAGNGARRAAADAKRQLIENTAVRLGVPAEELVCKDHRIYKESDPEVGMSYKEAVWAYEEDHDGQGIVGKGHFTHTDTGEDYDGFCRGNYAPSYSFSTGAAKVKVDDETGEVNISDFIFAHDCGRPLNPVSVEGQVEGSVQMGLGYALYEEMLIDENGVVRNPGFRDYKFPTALDMPKIQTIFCGEPDPVGPFGAKECGEGSTAPVAPAIANAITDATGIRFNQIPINPERLWRAMKDKKAE